MPPAGRLLAALLAASLLTACSAIPEPYGSRSPGASLGPAVNGTASMFGGPQDLQNPYTPSGGLVQGACGYGSLFATEWPYWAVAGISANNSLVSGAHARPMSGCGKCVQVMCQGGNCPADAQMAVVQVVDSCAHCSPTQVNLHYLTFSRFIANPSLGNVSVVWQQVECQPQGPIVAKVVAYRASGGGFLSLALESVAGSGRITNVELRSSLTTAASIDAPWVQMQNVYGAVWQFSGLPPLPWTLRISGGRTAAEQLVARDIIAAPVTVGKEYPTAVQFSTTTTPAYFGQPGSTYPTLPAGNVSVDSTDVTTGPGPASSSMSSSPAPVAN